MCVGGGGGGVVVQESIVRINIEVILNIACQQKKIIKNASLPVPPLGRSKTVHALNRMLHQHCRVGYERFLHIFFE